MTARCNNPNHKGHARFVGGLMDGQVSHQIHAHPSDYPICMGSALIGGGRSWYEVDQEASSRTEVVYRHIGDGLKLLDIARALGEETGR